RRRSSTNFRRRKVGHLKAASAIRLTRDASQGSALPKNHLVSISPDTPDRTTARTGAIAIAPHLRECIPTRQIGWNLTNCGMPRRLHLLKKRLASLSEHPLSVLPRPKPRLVPVAAPPKGRHAFTSVSAQTAGPPAKRFCAPFRG